MTRMQRFGAWMGPLLWAALLLLVACAESDDRHPDWKPLPQLDLSQAEEGVRQQLIEKRAAVEALVDQTPASQSNPSEKAQALGDLGLLYLTYDFLDAAEACLHNARNLESSDYRWHYLLAYLAKTQGRLEASIPGYEKALELRPDFLPALLRLGRARLALGEYDQAREQFERALELEPQVAAGHEGLGKAAAASGDLELAVTRFERALELEPTATGIHYAVAQVHRDLGDLDRARSHLEQSGDVAARVLDPLINPLASMAAGSQFYLVQGAEALDDLDYAAAVAAYRSAIKLDATRYVAYQGMAVGLENLGDAEGAEEALQGALGSAKIEDEAQDRLERASIHRLLGRLAALGKRDPEAIESYSESLGLNPEQPAILLRTANALARQRRFEEALAFYDRLVVQVPKWTPAVLEKRATVLVNLDRREEAIKTFEQAVEATPENARLRLLFAEALELWSQPEAAAEQRQAAQQKSDTLSNGPALFTEARDLLRKGDFAGAETRLRKALETNPEAFEARLELAILLGHTRRYDEAVLEYQQVIAAQPRHEVARRGRIVALILRGRLGEARVDLQAALRTFPRHFGFALTQVRLLALSPDPRVRDGALAKEIAGRVYAERQELDVRQAMALALAAAGDFKQALALQQEFVQAAEQSGDSSLLALERSRLTAFEQGQPWVAETADEILVALSPGR